MYIFKPNSRNISTEFLKVNGEYHLYPCVFFAGMVITIISIVYAVAAGQIVREKYNAEMTHLTLLKKNADNSEESCQVSLKIKELMCKHNNLPMLQNQIKHSVAFQKELTDVILFKVIFGENTSYNENSLRNALNTQSKERIL